MVGNDLHLTIAGQTVGNLFDNAVDYRPVDHRPVGAVRRVKPERQHRDCRERCRRQGCKIRGGIRHQHIAPPRHGAQPGLAVIAQRLTQVAHRLGQAVFGDRDIRPDRIEQFRLGDDPPRMAGQIEQQGKAFGAQMHRLPVAQQQRRAKVKPAVTQADDPLRGGGHPSPPNVDWAKCRWKRLAKSTALQRRDQAGGTARETG